MLLVTVFASAVTKADPNKTYSRTEQSHLLVELWRETCAKYYNNPLALRSTVLKAGYKENPPYADGLLRGQAGTVWDVSPSPSAQKALLLLDNGTCEVKAQRAGAAEIRKAFVDSVYQLETDGISIRKGFDRDVVTMGVPQNMMAFLVDHEQTRETWIFTAVTSDSDLSPTQVTLSISKNVDSRLGNKKIRP